MVKQYCIKIVLGVLFICPSLHAQKSKEDIVLELQSKAYAIMQKNEFYEAFKLLDSTLKIAKQGNYIKLEAKNYNLRGLTYIQLGQYDIANQYYEKAIHINDSIQNIERLSMNYSNLFHSYVLSGNLKGYDSIHPIVTKIQSGLEDDTEFYTHETELIAEYSRENYKKTLRIARQALIQLELPQKQIYFQGSDFKKLLKYRLQLLYEMYEAFALMELNIDKEKALAILTKLHNEDLENIMWYDIKLFKNISNIYNYKRAYYRTINRDSSQYYLDKLRENDNYIIQLLEEKTERTSRFIVDYIEKERALKESEFANKIQKNELHKSKLIIVFIAILTLILGVLTFLVSKSNRFRASVNNLLKKQNTELQNSIKEKENLESRISNIQNEINKDLHDNFGNRLAAIESSHEIIKDITGQENLDLQQFNKFSKSLEKSMLGLNADVKDLIWSNNTNNNELYKIIDRISVIAEDKKENFGVKINVINNAERNLKMPLFWNRQLILIVKEAFNNAIKHSNTNKIDLIVNCDTNGRLEMICKDYGLGFNVDELKRISGIHNMRVRANSIDCKLEIDSIINKGTSISLIGNIPI